LIAGMTTGFRFRLKDYRYDDGVAGMTAGLKPYIL